MHDARATRPIAQQHLDGLHRADQAIRPGRALETHVEDGLRSGGHRRVGRGIADDPRACLVGHGRLVVDVAVAVAPDRAGCLQVRRDRFAGLDARHRVRWRPLAVRVIASR